MRSCHPGALPVAGFCLGLLAALGVIPNSLRGDTGAIRPVTLSNTLPANDDGFSCSFVLSEVACGQTPLNIGGANGINFFGQNFTGVFVNNNGNLTFGRFFSNYTPGGIAAGVGLPLIAPFFADVDTTGSGSGVVQYGNAVIDGRNAFVANYVNVGYFDAHTDQLNSFQVALIDRTDTGVGNFDIEFNYNQICWETGDNDDGVNGFGGISAAAGYSNGLTGTNNVFYEFPGSRMNGALLNGGPNALVSHSLGSAVPGRYIFPVRNGVVQLGITTSALPSGSFGSPYTFAMSAAGGSGNYTWSGTGLPPGLSLSSSGLILGFPIAAGTFPNVGITVTDNRTGQTASQTYPLVIGSGGEGQISTLACSPASLNQNGVSTCTVTLTQGAPAGGSTVTLASDSASLTVPASIAFAAGVTSGTFSATAAASFGSYQTATVTATLGSSSKTATIGLVSATGLGFSGPLSLGTIVLGGSISGVVAARGGTGPYTYTATGTPAGVTITDGRIAGTPVAPGNYTVGVTVKDSRNSTATTTISFSVFGIVPVSLPAAITSSPYAVAISAAGGTPPYRFTGRGMPPAFSISTTGVLSGTATAAGGYTLSVSATDAKGLSHGASLPFSVTQAAPLKVSGGPLTAITVLAPVSQTLSATGGAPPYSWVLAGGSLPDGMSLRPTGVIAGTASKTGSYTFTAKATDLTGGAGIGTFTMDVTPPQLTITTPSPLASGMVSVDYPNQALSVTGGVEPYTFTAPANALPPGLKLSSAGAISGVPTTAGSSTFTVTVTDSKGQTGTVSLQIVVRPYSADLILSAGSLSFTLASGAAALPGTQTVRVQSTDVTKALSFSTANTPAATWLSVSPGGTTPASFSVALTSAATALAAQTAPYQTTILVTCLAPSPCAGYSQQVTVSLVVTAAPPQLKVLTDLLSFTTSSSPPVATSQNISVQNIGGGSIGFASLTCPPAWCKVGSAPSSLGAGVSGLITITADPTGLSPGYYYTNLTIVSSAGTTVVPITYFIAGNSSLTLNPSGIQLTMTAGGAAAVPDTNFLVDVPGPATIAWTATVLPGAPWLKLDMPSGNSSRTAPGSVSYSIDQTAAAALAPQAYYGTIRVASQGAVNSPQDFQVVLNVTTPTERAKPDPTPAGLLFISSGTTPAPAQSLTLYASSVQPETYQASVTTESGKPWLSVSPLAGTTSVSAPAHPTVSVSAAGLPAGVYHGTVSYALSSAAVRSVNVTLLVQPAAAAPSARPEGLHPLADALCTPAQLVPTQTGLVSNFATAASWPTPLEIQLVNDCGTPVTTGQIVATFSNGDPPLVMGLADPASGRYSGTWTPRRSGSQVIITAKATAPGLPAATAQISGSVVPNIAPLLTRNGTLHIFSPQTGAPLAPGTIVQIYGSSLAQQTTVNTTIPLATNLSGTSVVIGGLQAPLFFVSPGQVNAQIPFELTPGQTYQVIVSNNGALTTPDSLQSTAVAPGVAALPSGLANAQHVSDGSSITEASPAKPGEFVVVYLAGMGLTTVPVATGAGAPADPLAQTQSAPTITLNSAPASFLFSGLTPGLAGLYQIDLQVPADAPDGDLTLVVNQPGFQGTSVILPVHR